MRDLAPILDHLKSSRSKLVAVSEQIPAERWRESPSSGAWSAGEVIAHVTMVERRVLAGARKTMESAPVHVPLLKRLHRRVSSPFNSSRPRERKTSAPIVFRIRFWAASISTIGSACWATTNYATRNKSVKL